MSEPIIPPTKAESEQSKSTLEVERPAGTTSVNEDMAFEVEALAQKASEEIAEKIAAKSAEITTADIELVFLDDKLASGLALYRTFKAQCKLLQDSFQSVKKVSENALDELSTEILKKLPPSISYRSLSTAEFLGRKKTGDLTEAQLEDSGAGLLGVSIPSGLTAAANLLGMFAVDTEFHGKQASVSERAFVMSLAHYLKANSLDFSWPSLSFTIATKTGQDNVPDYLKALNSVTAAASGATEAIAELAELVNTLPKNDSRLPAARRALDRAHSLNDSAVALYDGIREKFFADSSLHGMTPSELLQLGYQMVERLRGNNDKDIANEEDQADNEEDGGEEIKGKKKDEDDTSDTEESNVYYVTAKVEKAGGSYRVRRHLWQALTGEPPLTFSGGCIVSYALIDPDGEILAARTETAEIAYRSHPKEWEDDRVDPGNFPWSRVGTFLAQPRIWLPIVLIIAMYLLAPRYISTIGHPTLFALALLTVGLVVGFASIAIFRRRGSTSEDRNRDIESNPPPDDST